MYVFKENGSNGFGSIRVRDGYEVAKFGESVNDHKNGALVFRNGQSIEMSDHG